ncbi:hypothetical protein HETIRDRAFT_481777 [Heterobasidion irregulare TC 32-1]|uniref:Serine protease n=1 Tax=Heterobasidion irregulare (strain TC 32-1) TaxID=747525 RepID=W4JNP4_HETIT|nr:uncharacterized protein HETIRDRAFT_481777 [Heterobasidion irregulare TC 32-1]ETW75104.1 hypothetical protein HETIRDRAFT_481777 [Heterobasidion irregulare TC 32-1]
MKITERIFSYLYLHLIGNTVVSDIGGLKSVGHRRPISSPSPTLSKESSYVSANAIASDATAAAPYTVSDWERTTYYNGISPDHPELLYRSDLLENPFPTPTGRHPHLPTKTVYGVFKTPLNAVWDTVAPQIREFLKSRKLCYSAIQTARFVTHGEDAKDTLGPIVIWIATHPTTTTAENAHDASPYILALLKANGVEGAVVEWYEGAVEKLSGPHLLRITDNTNPTHYVRRFLTAALGMPIVAAEGEATDAQGSATLFFHENKDKHGNPSTKLFGISTCHVLREATTTTYEFRGAGAPLRHVRLAGFHRFQRGLDEIKACIGGYGTDADLLAREAVELEAKPKSEDPEEEAEDEAAGKAKRDELVKLKKNIDVLEAFYKDINSQWGDLARRNIGHVDWAPKISVDVQGRNYTKDIGTFEVDAAKFKAQFKGNVVDLGGKFTPQQLTDMFYPQSAGRTAFKFPTNRQLRINGCLTRELLGVPDCFDSNGEPCLIVMKDGNTTDLTVGRYAGLEAYLCDNFGVESIELAIYNYDKQSGPFSAKGDSGSLIFDGEGHMVGVLHSGMPKGGSNHVTYATPAWWAIEQLKLKYPHADFNRLTF